MNVTSATQTQYTSQTQSQSSSVQETPKNNQQSRYEMLIEKGGNKTEAEYKELHHYNAMRPVKYLDEAGNAALNKALEGKTDDEKWSIKGILELEFMTSVKFNAQGGLDRQKFDSIDTSKSATEDRFNNYLETYDDVHPLDTLGFKDVVAKFLDIYTNSDSTKDVKNQKDSVVDKFLEDLYSKESISSASSITKENIQNKVNEYAQTLMENRGDTPESKLETSKMLNDYKKELLNDYKESLDGAKNDKMTLQQEAIVKVLLDENTKQASSLEKLLVNKEADKTQSVAVTVGTDETAKYNNLPDKFIDAVYDNSNTFGMFLNQNEKAMQLLDDSVSNMSEEEKSKFLFVFGHVGNENIFKAMSKLDVASPKEAIPYVQNEVASFKNDAAFAESLHSMFDNKQTPETEVDKLLKLFHEDYVNQ